MCAGTVARSHVGGLRAAALDDAHATRPAAPALSPTLSSTRRRLSCLPHLLRNGTAALRGIAHHSVNYARARSESAADCLSSVGVYFDLFAAVGRADP